MEACASFGFASGALEQTKFGFSGVFCRSCFESLWQQRADMDDHAKKIFLHVPCSDAVKSVFGPRACENMFVVMG